MKFKTAVIITARSKSSRLPNKILKNLDKKLKSIDILIKRAEKINLPIILATTRSRTDDKLCAYVKKKYKIKIFRGCDENKLLRWHNCYKKFKIENACIIEGDDIFFDYNIYKKLIKKVGKYDILSAHKSMITGVFSHVIARTALKKMYKYFKSKIDSEMIEPFIEKSKLKKKIIKVNKIFHDKKIRITLDYIEDLKVMSVLLKKFSPTENTIDLIKYLRKNKSISNINYFRENFWRKNQLKKISSINI